CGGLRPSIWIEWFTSIHRPLVPCTRKPIEYGRGSEVSCCSRMVSPFSQASVVVTMSPSLNFTLVLGWVVPPLLATVYSCSPRALVANALMWVKRLPRLMPVYIAHGPMPWLGYSSPLRLTECSVRQRASDQPLAPNSTPLSSGCSGVPSSYFTLRRSF